MKNLAFTFLFYLVVSNAYTQNLYSGLWDNSGGISNDYGAWGNYNYIREGTIDVPDEGQITFYHPDTAPQQNPTVFFISGWGRTYDSYDKFFKYLASLGYSVVNIYNYNPGSINTSYPNSLNMMQTAVNHFQNWIDTTKIGLMGHSYGGGSTIWLGQQVFDSNGLNWGANGRFIMVFAPWLSFLVEASDLQNYPPNVKLLMIQSYDDLHYGGPNYNTDPRALRAVYELINIPDSEKDFITMFSDNDPNHAYTYNGENYSYQANHYACYTGADNNPYDALDVYSSNRLAHAMLEYVFEGNQAAKNIALGNGSAAQKNMGMMPDLAVTDYYITTRPASVFEYKCADNQPGTWGNPDIWKLQDYCDDSDGDGLIDALSISKTTDEIFEVYPVPAKNFLHINLHNSNTSIKQVQVKNMTGKSILYFKGKIDGNYDVSSLKNGVYLIHITTDKHTWIKKIIIKH